MRRLCVTIFLGISAMAFGSAHASGFPCYVQMVKTKCWSGYSATFQRFNAVTLQLVGKPFSIPAHQKMKVFQISCKPGENLSLQVKFSPPIWEDQADKIYKGTKIYGIPLSLPEGSSRWVIPVCFSNDFTGLPIPPDVTRLCKCRIPKLKPQDYPDGSVIY